MIGEIIGLIAIGLVVGALGRLLHRGRDPMGLLATIAIGIASSLVVGLLIDNDVLKFILAVVVAVVLVALFESFVAGRHRLARRDSY
jgi:uncharacterized membrane protein YeaQ/YmgE (transglycosylase-associated protein family)